MRNGKRRSTERMFRGRKKPEDGMVTENVDKEDIKAGGTRTGETMLHLEVASTVQCTTPKTKDKKDATKGACAATW